MKEWIITPEKELSDMEIVILLDEKFKGLVNRMHNEMTDYSHKIKEEAKVIQSEIKKNIQGVNSEWKEARFQIKDLEQKEEINIHAEQK